MNIKKAAAEAVALSSRSDNIVFLIRDSKLLLGNSLYRIVYPLFAAVISINKTLLFAKDLVSLSRTVAERTVRAGRLDSVSEKVFLLSHNQNNSI